MFKNYSDKSNIPKPLIGLFFLGMAALFIFLLGNVIVYLWNNILVEVTSVNTITFWQAIGIFALSRILFGGFKFGHRHRYKNRKFRGKMRDKWINMSEAERADFKNNWKDWCKSKSS